MNVYTYGFISTCPNDNERISYVLVIESKQTIFAEDIVAACSEHKSAFHEVIADDLFTRLGGRQKITAEHCGVKIETYRGDL